MLYSIARAGALLVVLDGAAALQVGAPAAPRGVVAAQRTAPRHAAVCAAVDDKAEVEEDWRYRLSLYDTNHDGRIQLAEWLRFHDTLLGGDSLTPQVLQRRMQGHLARMRRARDQEAEQEGLYSSYPALDQAQQDEVHQ